MEEESKGKMTPGMRLYMCRIFPLLLILGGSWLTSYGGKILFRAEQSKSWPTTQGVIKESSIERGRKSSYRAKVIYDYTVDGNNFTGGRVFYGSFSTNKTDAQKVSDKYPKDKTVSVYYDPNLPARSVLEAGVKGQAYVRPGIGLGVVLAGILIAIFSPIYIKKRFGEEETQNPYAGPKMPNGR